MSEFEVPENFDTPFGPILRPKEIGEGRHAYGCMVSAQGGRVILDFFGPSLDPAALDPQDGPRSNEVVARIWLEPGNFAEIVNGFNMVVEGILGGD